MDKTNLQVIRESFGRVAYSHKTHEKAAALESQKNTNVKRANIVLTTLTSGTLISTIITSETVLLYITAVLSALMLGFTIFQLSFDPAAKAEKHRHIANELWHIREKYVNLIADITNGQIRDESIISRRDQLIEELKLIYKFSPQTDAKSYEEARNALRLKEELTFSDEEIDQFLPDELRVKRNIPPTST
jgi:hypothetical protein